MRDSPDSIEIGPTFRIKHRHRQWFIVAGIVAALLWLTLGGGHSVSQRVPSALALVLASAALAAWLRRDRCSACRAALPVRVFDEGCPGCGRVITAVVVDDERRVELPARARRLAPGAEGKDGAAFRVGSTAARDAADAALEEHDRTDVDGIKKRLRADPKIARALRDRDDAALYRIVRERRKRSWSIPEDAALDALVNDPRRHLDPKKRPWLGVRAGSGLTLSLPHDLDRTDGSFLAEQLLVVGTYPIAPIAAYALRRPEEGGVEVLGRVPLPFLMRAWRALVALPFAALLTWGALGFVGSLSSKVHLINALDIPVTISIDGEAVRVAIDGREMRSIRRGKHHLITRDERGAVIEEQELDVPGGDALVAYNVLGAGPLIAREIAYSDRAEWPSDLQGELLLGQRVLVRENVSYPFVDAPEHIPGGGPDVRTWQVTLLPGGWRGTLTAVALKYQKLDPVPLVEAVSLAEPESEDAVRAALEKIRARDGEAGARAHLARLAARAPGSAAVRAAMEKVRGPGP